MFNDHVRPLHKSTLFYRLLFTDFLLSPQSPSLFEQTVRDTDEEFYATFPEARAAALTRSDFSQQLYSCTDSPVSITFSFSFLFSDPIVFCPGQ